MISTKSKRLVAATAIAGFMAIAPVGFAAAGDAPVPTYDSDTPAESYPMPTDPNTVPPKPAQPLPATGSDSTGLWLKVGGGAVLAGGLLVAATSRRRSASEQVEGQAS